MNISAVYTSNNGYDTITLYDLDDKELLYRFVISQNNAKELILDFEDCLKTGDWSNWGGGKEREMAMDVDGNPLYLDDIIGEIVEVGSREYAMRTNYILGASN